MARKPITMLQIRRILQLLEKGYSKRKIASVLQSGRHTIDDYVMRIEQSGKIISQLFKLNDEELGMLLYSGKEDAVPDGRYDDFLKRIDAIQLELKRTGVTRLRLWQEYKEEVPEGYSYSQFCEHLSAFGRKNAATMHFEHRPGEKLQIDFAGKPLTYVDQSTGEIITCPVLVCVLPYSGYSYVEALPSAGQEYLFAALGRCLSYFGGVPQVALSDNMRQYVKKSNRYEPIFSDVCEQWALHYNIDLTATRVAKPKDKPSVENMVHIAYMRVYAPMRNEVFHSIEELNYSILDCLGRHHATPMQKHSYSRLERFEEEEKPLLRALPADPFVIKHVAKAKVQKNYHVILGEDRHQYSVPWQNIGKNVKIIYDLDEVEIYLSLTRIAVHKRNARNHGYSTMEEHMPEKHRKYAQTKGWDADYFLARSREIGECSSQVMARMLQSKIFIEQTYNACLGLLRLSDKYGSDRYEMACKRALTAPRITYGLVNNILINNLDKQTEEQMLLFTSIPDHENIRGAKAYH